jgi:hypothetical protein
LSDSAGSAPRRAAGRVLLRHRRRAGVAPGGRRPCPASAAPGRPGIHTTRGRVDYPYTRRTGWRGSCLPPYGDDRGRPAPVWKRRQGFVVPADWPDRHVHVGVRLVRSTGSRWTRRWSAVQPDRRDPLRFGAVLPAPQRRPSTGFNSRASTAPGGQSRPNPNAGEPTAPASGPAEDARRVAGEKDDPTSEVSCVVAPA